MSTHEPSFQNQRRQRFFVAAVLASLGVGAASYAFRSPLALAEPESVSPSDATTPMTPESVQLPTADADLDYGPGNCEPCLVGSP